MKILYVSTISNTINTFLIPHIKMLIEKGHTVDVACNIQREIDPLLLEYGCKIYDLSFSRSPFDRGNYKAYKELKKIVTGEQYDIIHTHTPIASAIVRVACKNIKQTRVFYTAHGFHFYKGAPIKSWMIYYPIEKALSRYTDTLITINKEDYKTAKNKFNAKKTEYIAGVGLNMERFEHIVVDKETKKKELGVPVDSQVLLSIGELNKNKNHEIVIEAIAKLHNEKIHYIICGEGPLNDYLINLSEKLGIERQIHLTGLRKDIPEICKASDVFVFPSIREGLSVALMESMASGLPVICTNIRGNSDLIENKKGGFLIRSGDADAWAKYINELTSSNELKKKFSCFNLEKIKKFSIVNILSFTEKIYS
ncbi:Putative glycosyltransferase EpsD [Jeotgalibaca dankookensis]|uniref:Putative glycosyltransferase EpsD n=1 Tax=Jeotgalibaca dankookensis TaxID=708126 RepID=A0A1S6IMB3_9LACT|nr:glycosyltransferase family 4 protein [Jeotgalibaca dankookensis]AQS52641.1 Putative glycosyltransferase EpsD [Jeotgalibaca dankookensis]